MWKSATPVSASRTARNVATRRPIQQIQKPKIGTLTKLLSSKTLLSKIFSSSLYNSYRTWQPLVWLKANAMSLATYQLFLEASCTGIFAWLILYNYTTPTDIETKLRHYHYPFMSLIDLESGKHIINHTFAGLEIDAKTLTAIHTGHNIATGVLPLQIIFMIFTYPLLARRWAIIRGPLQAKLQKYRIGRFMGNLMKRNESKSTSVNFESFTPVSSHPFGKSQRGRRK